MDYYSKSAEIYDIINQAGKNYAKESKIVIRFVRQFKRSPGNSLLDVACGTGQHVYFLKKSFEAEGLDVSSEMLRIARKRNPGVIFHRGNMATFSFRKRYDVITCLFSAVGYMRTLRGLRAAIRNMAQHLKPGGLLVVEPWLTPAKFQKGRIDAVVVNQPKLKVVRMNRTQVKGGLSLIDFHYLVGMPEGIRYFTELHSLGLFSRAQYEDVFRGCGLSVRYFQRGLTGRGLYIGLKPQSETARSTK